MKATRYKAKASHSKVKAKDVGFKVKGKPRPNISDRSGNL